jgi:hypothetical protein
VSTASYHLDDTISTICNKNNMNKENGKDTVRGHMPSRPGNNVTRLIFFFFFASAQKSCKSYGKLGWELTCSGSHN